MTLRDLTGQRFERLVVVRRVDNNRHGQPMWECRCDCGAERVVNGGNLCHGHSRSCGCLAREVASKRELIDLTGRRFGRLTALRRAENLRRQTRWLCRCDCGNEKIIHGSHLQSGHTMSCGCLTGWGARAPVDERFWRFVSPEPNSGCWLWTGADTRGYGALGKNGLAHRVSFEMHVGPILPGLTLDHLCRTPACVNPAHLEPVTLAENVRRSLEARGFPQDPLLRRERYLLLGRERMRERRRNDPERYARQKLHYRLRDILADMLQYDLQRMLTEPKAFARLLRRQARNLGKLAGIEPPAELLAALKAVETMG